jgi:hypothetical protein
MGENSMNTMINFYKKAIVESFVKKTVEKKLKSLNRYSTVYSIEYQTRKFEIFIHCEGNLYKTIRKFKVLYIDKKRPNKLLVTYILLVSTKQKYPYYYVRQGKSKIIV